MRYHENCRLAEVIANGVSDCWIYWWNWLFLYIDMTLLNQIAVLLFILMGPGPLAAPFS
jgi:hypothetical protein